MILEKSELSYEDVKELVAKNLSTLEIKGIDFALNEFYAEHYEQHEGKYRPSDFTIYRDGALQILDGHNDSFNIMDENDEYVAVHRAWKYKSNCLIVEAYADDEDGNSVEEPTYYYLDI